MMFFTSDTHFSHTNIIRYCNRPFADTDEMDEFIIKRWNETVSPEDTVFHLGDIALGPIAKSLPKIARLNGYKIAILGNHDRPFMRHGKADEQKWWDTYAEVFHDVMSWAGMKIELDGHEFKLSHFPYEGDSHGEDRYESVRPVDRGLPLIHGHSHSPEKVSWSQAGSLQIHVGVDAWEFRPVSEEEILEIFMENR